MVRRSKSAFTKQQPYSPHYDEDFTEEQAYLYLIHNSEQVLFSKGSATRKHRDWGWEDWEFSQFGANRLELVKLDATWISAVNEISSELRRVEKLEKERYERHLQEEAEKKKIKLRFRKLWVTTSTHKGFLAMTDTNHQNELKEVKEKAFKILKEEGVLSAIETVVNLGLVDDGLLGKFDSPIKEVAPNTDIETEHEEKRWTHRAYLLGGVQTIQISYWSYYARTSDVFERQVLYVFNNSETVLHDSGGCEIRYTDWGTTTAWKFDDEFDEYGASWIESVKLNKIWMGALKEIASEIQRVKTIEASQSREERNRADELEAEKENQSSI